MQEFSYIADHVLFESMHIGDSQKFAEIPRDPHSSLRGGQKKNKKTILVVGNRAGPCRTYKIIFKFENTTAYWQHFAKFI